MITSLAVILVVFFMHYSLQGNQNPVMIQKKGQQHLFIISFILIFLAAVRKVVPYTDADGYMVIYNTVSKMNFKELAEVETVSIVYTYLAKIFSLTHLSYHFWFAFVELLFLTAFIRVINKFSDDKLLCVFLLYTIGLYGFSLNGQKQAIAMAIIWHGFMDLYEKKYLRSVIMVILAYYCHKSAMVFLLAYIMPFIQKAKSINFLLITSISIIIIFSYTVVLNQLTFFLGDEHYESYLDSNESYTASTLIFYIILFSTTFFAKKQKTVSEDLPMIVGLAVVAVLSQLFAFRVATAFRLSLYYLPFLIIYVSNQLKNNKPLQYLVFLFGAVWLLYTSRFLPYKFFWQ